MNDETASDSVTQRAILVTVGLAAGGSAWLFAEVLPDVLGRDRLFLFLLSTCFAQFSVLMALLGPSRFMRALGPSAGLALLSGTLLTWASLRHPDTEAYIALTYPLLAYGLILFVCTPFLATWLTEARRWKDYSQLFNHSWQILVRYLASSLFLGVFWALVFLSDALLKIVGISVIEQIIDIDVLPYLLSGAVFGFALAVVHELRAYISPYLVLRLLRLLVPLVLVVVIIFVLALPFSGLSGLVGSFSPAATLGAVAMASVTLITIAVDQNQESELSQPFLRFCVQALALIAPVLGILAVYAIWQRVAQYGWTPERLIAATLTTVIAVYGLIYACAVLARTNWTGRIRGANIVVAQIWIGLCVLWLTPLFHPEKISANSQVSLFREGVTEPANLPLYELSHQWGFAGQSILSGLEATESDLSDAISRARGARSRWELSANNRATQTDTKRSELLSLMPVYPASVVFEAGALDKIGEYLTNQMLKACRRTIDGRPGCAVVFGEFFPDSNQATGIIFMHNANGFLSTTAVKTENGALRASGGVLDREGGKAGLLPLSVLNDIANNRFTVAPARVNALKVGEFILIPHN